MSFEVDVHYVDEDYDNALSDVELTEFQVYIHKSALSALLLLHTTFLSLHCTMKLRLSPHI
jgi:hypothetical protein